MMPSVKVIGAGSIGNHLAHGCRQQGWNVTIVDLDENALKRTREEIYPSRYGNWDEGVVLANPEQVAGKNFDIVIVGTPPATHLAIATAELSSTQPTIIMIEKPLAHPDSAAIRRFANLAEDSASRVLVGYNQRCKPNTLKFLELARAENLGELKSLKSQMLESWDGILRAHFWMTAETDSYLAFTDQGGGALLEHSHALNLLLHFAAELGQGTATRVGAKIDWVEHEFGRYDRDSTLFVTLESGLVGEVRQDVHSWPAIKQAVAEFEHGTVTWEMGNEVDKVTREREDAGVAEVWHFPKTRPDDFRGEIEHLNALLANPELVSPLDLRDGLDVMRVALAAFESSDTGVEVNIEPLRQQN